MRNELPANIIPVVESIAIAHYVESSPQGPQVGLGLRFKSEDLAKRFTSFLLLNLSWRFMKLVIWGYKVKLGEFSIK